MDQQIRRIAVFGAGGHGKVVIDAIERQPLLAVACVADDRPLAGARLLGHPLIGGREALLGRRADIDAVIVAIGDNRARVEVARWIVEQGLPLAIVVHPAAVVAPSASIGAGTLVMPGAVVNADARIGANAIINSGAIVEHDCIVGDGVHVAPRAVLCGGASVGTGTLVGAGAVVLPGVRVAAALLVKAGTVVARDMEAGA
jgi:sugar O-acyltransferase (sialic acid O-acetyltransferase NeuD family)